MKIPMLCGSFSSTVSQPGRKSKASSSGTKKEESHTAQASFQQGAQSSGPALKRSNSQPTHLPSSPHQPEEVKTARQSITHPKPDTKPPVDFEAIAGGEFEGVLLKRSSMVQAQCDGRIGDFIHQKVKSNPEYMDFLKSVHPKYDEYNSRLAKKAIQAMVDTHPEIVVEVAGKRNEWYAIPNQATSSRVMKPKEQKFLAKALQHINKDVAEKSFHIHGESGVIGTKKGEIRWFDHSPGNSITIKPQDGDKYVLHSHPPFGGPFTSSASSGDHEKSARSYNWFKANEYLTNGKDVLHIHPTSMELVKLIPNPKVEKKLGKFPEAFRLPDPQRPSHPFPNHEAPAALNKEWEPPAGWIPDPNYPRTK